MGIWHRQSAKKGGTSNFLLKKRGWFTFQNFINSGKKASRKEERLIAIRR